MSKIKAAVEATKAAAKAAKTVTQAAAIKGQALGKGVQAVAKVVSAHPTAATRIYGGYKAIQGIKDIKAYKTTRDKGTLIRGIARTLIGSALVIFNDKEWYLKNGEIKPAYNDQRPMDPIYNTSFTTDATIGSVGKLVDVNIDWQGYSDSLAFSIATTKTMSLIRENLKSNLPYNVDLVRQYLIDSVALSIIMAQMGRQFKYYRMAPAECPNFYKLWNTKANGDEGYGPTALVDLSHYSKDANVATTIAVYDTLVDAINGHVRLPKHLAEFISYYFSNLFVTDTDDSNTQYVAVRAYNINAYFNQDKLHPINISDLNPSDFTEIVDAYVSKYSIIAADCDKAGVYDTLFFMKFADLVSDTNMVYSKEIAQAIINAYTSDSAVFDGYIRLDNMPDVHDDLTTYMFLGAVQDQNDPLYVPAFRTKSMMFKFASNSELDWDHDLTQGEFDFSKDFGFIIQTDIYADTIIDVSTNTYKLLTSGDVLESSTTGQASINVSTTANVSPLAYDVVMPGADCINLFTIEDAYDEYDIMVSQDNKVLLVNGSDITDITSDVPVSTFGTAGVSGFTFSANSGITIDLEHNLTLSGEITLTAVNSSYSSFNNLKLSLANPDPDYAVTSGFANLAGFIADQFDYHLPMINHVRTQISIDGSDPDVVEVGSSMLKEAYIPYWYNIKDLGSILYNMFYSLFLPNDSN